MDRYLHFVNGVQAMRRRTEALTIALGGALGVAADPLPHQLATVRRILSAPQVHHLISDEVGLGKTVQALMIMNALRWQDPNHRTLIIAPDSLLSQWQEECWIRAHVMPTLAGLEEDKGVVDASVTLARPRDLIRQTGREQRAIRADPAAHDLLVIDEPQTMSREAIQSIAQAAETFREVLVLSATPRLGDDFWKDQIIRMIEPQVWRKARFEARSVEEVLSEREAEIMNSGLKGADQGALFELAAAGRRVIRNGRADWSDWLPQRTNFEVRVRPLATERMRHEIAARILTGTEPTDDMQGQAWTFARTLQRNSQAARDVLQVIGRGDGCSAQEARSAREALLEDPGDSRFEALLDILSEQWTTDPNRTFIVVCGDNPTIDMLRGAIPRYFKILSDEISILRRPATAEVEGVESLRGMQEALAPLLERRSRILLVGDWVQAGLNLQHAARGIIFYSLPWEIDAIDQLIGRIDRLGGLPARDGKPGRVRIWRIVQEGSQDAAVAEFSSVLGIFDRPLPPLSSLDRSAVQLAMTRALIERHVPQGTATLVFRDAGLSTSMGDWNPHTADLAVDAFKDWSELPLPEPVINYRKLTGGTPVRRSEEALNGWLEVISRSSDFDIQPRRDNMDERFGFDTIWYHRPDGRSRAGKFPFQLPDTPMENWLSNHQPYISRRVSLSVPPRKTVHTDEGEGTGRPLNFMDHGNRLHDSLVSGYMEALLREYGGGGEVTQCNVILPEKHPAMGQDPMLVTVAIMDPFPDAFIPAEWSSQAKTLLNQASTDAQIAAMTADRKALRAGFLAMQRWVRLTVPAELIRIGSQYVQGKWETVEQEEIDIVLRPLQPSSKGKACAKGREPMRSLAGSDTVKVERRHHLQRINAAANDYRDKVRMAMSAIIEGRMTAEFRSSAMLIKNREVALERRRSSPPVAGPRELWEGQVAALERSLEMARLNGSETLESLKDLAMGRLPSQSTQSASIFLSFSDAG